MAEHIQMFLVVLAPEGRCCSYHLLTKEQWDRVAEAKKKSAYIDRCNYLFDALHEPGMLGFHSVTALFAHCTANNVEIVEETEESY